MSRIKEKIEYRQLPDGSQETTSYYPCGNVRSRYSIKNGSFQGLFTAWYANGKKRREELYVNGMVSGTARTWHEEGGLKTIERYDRDGKVAGMWREWDKSGKLILVRIYIPNRFRLTRMDLLELKILHNELTAMDVVTERNLTLRRILMEDFGKERIVQELGAEVIEDLGEEQLLRVNLPEDEPMVVVKVRCPSTGAYYMLRVPPTTKTVREGIAWTFGLDEDLYDPEIET